MDVRRPAGDLYDWYQRGLTLLRNGDPAAASQVLAHAHEAQPEARSIREALARARFDSGDVRDSARIFSGLVAEDPADDYAHFGLGLALSRLGDDHMAHGHLAMAATMRPSVSGYQDALTSLRRSTGVLDRRSDPGGADADPRGADAGRGDPPDEAAEGSDHERAIGGDA